jgi:hypothetical protein
MARFGEKIILRPIRASDFEGELESLADALRGALDVGVEVWSPLKSPPGAFPSGVAEVLSVILPFAGGYAFDAAADLIVGRLREALRDRDDDPESGGRVVEIYGPSGEILKRIRIPDDVDGIASD